MSYYQNCRNSFTTDQFEVMQGTIGQIPEIKYLIDVQFSNKINGVNQSGTSLHVDGETVNSGDSKQLFYGITHEGKTDQEIINTNYKHHDWNGNGSQFHLVEDFDIDKDNPVREANFISIDPINIKNSMTEVSYNDLGTKQLRDPWWVDPSGNQPDDFRTLSSPNVNIFLNQSGPPLWNSPYYSVQAISPQTIYLSQTGKDHKFYFQNWSGSDITFEDANSASTGIVFI